jgi:hypothetical protein
MQYLDRYYGDGFSECIKVKVGSSNYLPYMWFLELRKIEYWNKNDFNLMTEKQLKGNNGYNSAWVLNKYEN